MWHNRPNTKLVVPSDKEFFNNLFTTPQFRALLEDGSTGYGVLLELASLRPWWFVDAQESYERYHFSIWLGDTFLRRSYANPVITDLYYWHDLVHALTFRTMDASVKDFETWRLAMRSNEIAASIETEMLIYLRNDDLRKASFDHRIWLDDLTIPLPQNLSARLDRYREKLASDVEFATSEHNLLAALPDHWPLFHPTRAIEQGRDFLWFWELRRATTLWPDENNAVEQALHRYEQQANPFYMKWFNHWREVEDHRAQFSQLIEQGQWERAVDLRHEFWAIRADANGVPFGDLAPRPKKRVY